MSPRLQQVYKAFNFQRQQWSKYRREREWFWRFMGMNPSKLHVEELNINATFGKMGSIVDPTMRDLIASGKLMPLRALKTPSFIDEYNSLKAARAAEKASEKL